MRNLPDPELTVFASSKEHILQFIVVNVSHSVCEARLKHKDAFATFFHLTYPQIALLRALTVAGHSGEPLESCEAVIAIALIAINAFYYC